MPTWLDPLLTLLALPQYSLGTVFVVSFLSATLLPMGSEPVVFGLVQLNPELFWPVILVATLGNTLGGMVTYYMGRLLPQHLAPEKSALARRHGPPVLLLAWTPVVGDALCAAAGWLRLNWLQCALWMLLGKLARYVVVLWLL